MISYKEIEKIKWDQLKNKDYLQDY